jgi:hypothetical protein
MKAFSTIIKILAVIAAVAGIIFILATYGDQIVAWCKRLLEKVRAYRNDFDHEGEFGDSYEEFSIPEDDEDSVAADIDFE